MARSELDKFKLYYEYTDDIELIKVNNYAKQLKMKLEERIEKWLKKI